MSRKPKPKPKRDEYLEMILRKKRPKNKVEADNPKPKPLTYEQLMAAQREECKDPESILNWTMRSGIGSDAARWLVDEFDIFPKEKSKAAETVASLPVDELRELKFPELTDEDRTHLMGIIDRLDRYDGVSDETVDDDARFLLGLVNDLGCALERAKKRLMIKGRLEI